MFRAKIFPSKKLCSVKVEKMSHSDYLYEILNLYIWTYHLGVTRYKFRSIKQFIYLFILISLKNMGRTKDL